MNNTIPETSIEHALCIEMSYNVFEQLRAARESRGGADYPDLMDQLSRVNAMLHRLHKGRENA